MYQKLLLWIVAGVVIAQGDIIEVPYKLDLTKYL